ncbi:rCG45218 [Rattus norvegicus]|uniref:RCG45218 n=1 Tax=Rattus norvegicus TaxID=10116 RepID=A6KLD6_RAT|nr:rCG45218 [Rattus norvegicus]
MLLVQCTSWRTVVGTHRIRPGPPSPRLSTIHSRRRQKEWNKRLFCIYFVNSDNRGWGKFVGKPTSL